MKTAFLTIVFVLAASTYVDYIMTYNAIQTGRYAEGNVLTRGFVNHPAIALSIITIMSGVFCVGMESLYKDNKAASWTILGLVFLVKGYVLWHNIYMLRRH